MEQPPATGKVDPRETGQIVRDVVAGTQTLFRQELELARQEIIAGITARAIAAGAAGAAAVMLLFALGFLASAGARGLNLVLPAWLAWLIVGLVFVLIAVVALMVARAKLKSVPMSPERAKRSTKENVEWARHQLRR